MFGSNIEKENIKLSYLIGLITLAYIFSIAVRMIWVYQFSNYDEFYWNSQLMINTNDGYIWASSALNELSNQFENNPRIVSMYEYAVVFFTFIAVKVLPFSLDTVILYMPAVISSLVVIPIILLARLYNLTLLGFFSALIGSIAWSYYNRTMVGYYDTDMFSAMAPMFILYFLIKTIEDESLNNALYSALAILIYPFLYDAGLPIVYAIGIIYMTYMVLFHRFDSFTYQSIILVSIALMGLPWLVKLLLILSIYILFLKKDFKLNVLIISSVLVFFALFLSSNIFMAIISKVASYVIRGTESDGLAFFQVKQTVREAGTIPFETMANRISGSIYGVVFSAIGYILLVIKYRPLILALPLIGIGFFSLWGGLRFTVYAVPIAAISSVFLFYVLFGYFKSKAIRYTGIVFLVIVMLYPNITHIIGYRVPTVLTKSEVNILDKLKSISNEKDYTITWWDYGYPIWYYSNTNTLIDGGKHGPDNFIVSKILTTSSQTQAAYLSRLAIETYESNGYTTVANTIFKNDQEENIDPNILLDELTLNDFNLPDKTREIFLYLPNRMMKIFPTVDVFSNIDLKSGTKVKRPFFYKTNTYNDLGNRIALGSGVELFKSGGKLKLGKNTIYLKEFITTQYNKNGTLNVKKQLIDINSNISVIFMKNYNQFLILDNRMLNSTYIKMFVLEEYDKSLFEAVILSPRAKVYKLKI